MNPSLPDGFAFRFLLYWVLIVAILALTAFSVTYSRFRLNEQQHRLMIFFQVTQVQLPSVSD